MTEQIMPPMPRTLTEHITQKGGIALGLTGLGIDIASLITSAEASNAPTREAHDAMSQLVVELSVIGSSTLLAGVALLGASVAIASRKLKMQIASRNWSSDGKGPWGT